MHIALFFFILYVFFLLGHIKICQQVELRICAYVISGIIYTCRGGTKDINITHAKCTIRDPDLPVRKLIYS